ncbi:unnamed protein product [Adineta ricciae]|uniref:Uncharacterized protein n=1 Tax=Adineta ricciae TaxID=249248 RepID=A0A815KTD7_ADIRI|nr:unnamed protein product [Adineta ricciae]CAF1399869.1 unnamed protein product [Adineta ricciae]
MTTKLYLTLFVVMTLCQISLTRPMAISNTNHISSMHPTGTEYKNAQFQFSVVLPHGWHSRGLVKMFEKHKRDIHPFIIRDHTSVGEQYKEVAPVFFFSKYDIDRFDGKSNPNIQAAIYSVQPASEAYANCGFLHFVQRDIEASQRNKAILANDTIEFADDCTISELDRILYASQTSHVKTNQTLLMVKQKRFARLIGKTHILYMVLNYSNEHSEKQLLAIMKSIRSLVNA